MSGWFIATLLAVAALVLGIVVAAFSRNDESKEGAIAVCVGSLVVGLVTLLIGSTFFVGTKELGVVTGFGKVTGVMESGPHLAAPWSKVEKYPTSLQVIDLKGKGCVRARIANGTLACTDIAVQFKLIASSEREIKDLYREYRSFKLLKSRLVIPQVRSIVNGVMETHDPFKVGKERNSEIEAAIRSELQRRLGAAVEVVAVMRGVVDYDDATDKKLAEQGQAIANTTIAEQNAATNAKQAEANKALAGDASRDPAILYQNCLNITRDLVQAGKALPATWTCTPPWGGGQQQAGVIVGQK